MAECAVEVGRPEVAEEILAAAACDRRRSLPRCGSPRGGRARSAATRTRARHRPCHRRGHRPPTTDLKLARRSTSRVGARLPGRQSRGAGPRGSARRGRGACRGRTQAQLRAVVQLGKIELFAGQAPESAATRRSSSRDEAGALVELGWAQENLAIALGIQGDLPASAGAAAPTRSPRAARCGSISSPTCWHRSAAIASSYVTSEGIEETLAEAEALMDTTDLRLHTSSIRADIALPGRPV